MGEPEDVFVSYSRQDNDKVLELTSKLRSAGVRLWMDVRNIDGAAMWGEEIVNALTKSKVLLLLVSKAAVTSQNVVKEVLLASERKGHILPVDLEATDIPGSLKYALAGIQHIEYFRGDPDEHMKAIIRSLERLGVAMTATDGARAPAPVEARESRADAPVAEGTEALRRSGALAVLPFDNISPDESAEYFSDGLTEELIARLSLVSEIELVSRWASMQFKGGKQDLKTIGRELGARYIVGGGVRKFHDSVRITVQLVDVVTNRQIWGDTYKGKLDDIFEIQEQVAKQIVEALKLKLSFSEKLSLTKRQTGNVQAYDLYLRGQDYLYRLTKRSVEYAIQLFEKAIELDPRYAAAYAACSGAYGQMYQYFSRQEKYREKAQEFSFKALMYDSNLPDAYAAMALSYFIWSKFDEAAASGRKAIELDPDNFIAYWTLGRIHFSTSRFEEALELFQKAVDIKPGFYVAYLDLKQTYVNLGRKGDAQVTLHKIAEILPNYLLQNPDDARAKLFHAMTLLELGRRDEAIAEGTAALELAPDDSLMLYNCACLYAQLGEKKRAIETLRNAIDAGVTNFQWMVRDPDLASLRDDPEFIELSKDR
jgi:TolB-like protein/cytochrome c-type biogenesis protein CcmH/NrfG